jgi:phenylacetate-CoA ligase
MNTLFDRAFGFVASKAGDATNASWLTYRLLFAPPIIGPTRSWISRRRAAAAFYNARRHVPAYREFLAKHGAMAPRRFEEIPPMDKRNYITQWPIEQLCLGGRIPLRGAVIDESSGSSGTATNWVRGAAERAATRRLIQYSTRATLGDEGFILLNCFALGPWATGMNVSMSLVEQCIVKSIGPDAGKAIATLKLFGPKYKYVIAGYPPFLKSLVDSADLDWTPYDISAIVGGEGMSEPLRAALNKRFKRTISCFGASDLEINLAVETPFTVALREAIMRDERLGGDIYGCEGLPMIFQYDPLNTFVESDPERSLLFTINRLENVSPRIRYNIHDRGVVRTVAELEPILRDHGLSAEELGLNVALPVMFHWGRQDSSVGFYGCKITPEDIQQVLLRVGPTLGAVANFALHPYEDADANKRLELWLEMESGVALPADGDAATDDVLRELGAVNQDFRESVKMIRPALRPTVVFHPFGESPMSDQDIRLKRKYIM